MLPPKSLAKLLMHVARNTPYFLDGDNDLDGVYAVRLARFLENAE